MMAATLYLVPPIHARWMVPGSFDADLLGLQPRPLAELLQVRAAVEGTPRHRRMLEVGAVGTVIALHRKGFEDLPLVTALAGLYPEPIHVYRVPAAVPRVYAVAGTWPAEGRAAFDALLDPRFDPHRMIPHGSSVPAPQGFKGEVQVAEARPDRWRVSASLSSPGYVVFVDAYDPGWKARVDGAEAPVLRANVAFRAVPVEAGTHAVELEYRPGGLRLGLAITAAALFAWSLALGWTFRRRRQAAPAA